MKKADENKVSPKSCGVTEEDNCNDLASHQPRERIENTPSQGSSKLGTPELTDFLAYQVTQKAKRNVLAYFGILGVVISIFLTLFGIERITKLIDESYREKIQEKESIASKQIEVLQKQFDKRLQQLEREAILKSDRFHNRINITLKEVEMAATANQTAKIDLSIKIGAIENQGNEGTTVGFALAYALQAEIQRVENKTVSVSARSIYVEAKRYDDWPGEDYSGTSIAGGLKALKYVGAYLEEDWPYEDEEKPKNGTQPAYQIVSFKEIEEPGRIGKIVNELHAGKIPVISVQVTTDFYSLNVAKDGQITISEDGEPLGGHCLTIVGYDPGNNMFKFANSWGAKWGDKGFGYISKSDLDHILNKVGTISLLEIE